MKYGQAASKVEAGGDEKLIFILFGLKYCKACQNLSLTRWIISFGHTGSFFVIRTSCNMLLLAKLPYNTSSYTAYFRIREIVDSHVHVHTALTHIIDHHTSSSMGHG